MIAGKALPVYTDVFPPKDYQENDRIIYKYFKDKYDKGKCKP